LKLGRELSVRDSRETPELGEVEERDVDAGWCGRGDLSAELRRALIRPPRNVRSLKMQESVFSESEAHLPEDLELLRDQRSLDVVQWHASPTPQRRTFPL